MAWAGMGTGGASPSLRSSRDSVACTFTDWAVLLLSTAGMTARPRTDREGLKELVLPISQRGCMAAAAIEGLGLCEWFGGSEGLLSIVGRDSERAASRSFFGSVCERFSCPKEPKSKDGRGTFAEPSDSSWKDGLVIEGTADISVLLRFKVDLCPAEMLEREGLPV